MFLSSFSRMTNLLGKDKITSPLAIFHCRLSRFNKLLVISPLKWRNQLKYCITTTYARVMKWIMLAKVSFVTDQNTFPANMEIGNTASTQ